LKEFLGSRYPEIAASVEQQLTGRKKAKIVFDPQPESEFIGNDLLGKPLSASKYAGREYCVRCRKRLALYMQGGDPVCGGCLHKIHAGKLQKGRYMQAYQKEARFEVKEPASFEEIGTHKGDPIAVLYADGNNMGGIIQHISTVADMMDFSDFVRETMPQIVYQSLASCEIQSPEITALGGDDVFILIPADRSVSFAVALIERYKKEFSQKFPDTDATLSVGICIIKPNTPVKVALEAAEEELKAAKLLVREDGGEGSLSFRVFLTYEGAVSERGRETLMPYSVKAVKQLLAFAEPIRNLADVKTRLQLLNAAFHDAECHEEADLFLKYVNAKESEQKKRLNLPQLDGYQLNGGFYKRTGHYGDTLAEEKRTGYIWNDLLYLLQYGGDGN
jgi:GGDEF domain-containing protein